MIDVCLLLEGTYPYVAGGVSTWVHQLITAMKDIRFGIIYIAPNSDPTRQMKYEVPNHVLYMKEIYLHEYDLKKTRSRRPRAEDYTLARDFYQDLGEKRYDRFPEFIRMFAGEDRCFDMDVLFSSKKSWKMLTDLYDEHAEGISFLDFFWTWRGTHLPLAQVVLSEIPRAKIYHSISTGYAGLLGAIAKVLYGEKYFLTEHGIYTHERMLEISQANWIYEQEKNNFRAERELSFFKRWWISMFEAMSHLTYNHADRIFTLYEGNKLREMLEGAPADKISVIPNGIDIHGFDKIQRIKKEKPQIGLIGRVVTIKDIKTFIHAAKLVLNRMPKTQFYIVGPTDEEEEYYDECRMLVEVMGLEEQITFTGRVDAKDYYSFLDVVVLTSLSEAQPYVVLEANVVGIPVVATDVGSCRELLEGRDPEDRALGASGLLTEVSNPEATANAILRLVCEADLYTHQSVAGRERVRKYYDQDDLLSRYLNIYEKHL